MRVFQRYSAVVLTAATILLGYSSMVRAQGNTTPTSTTKVTPYFSPKPVVLLTATAPPDKKTGKGPDERLAKTADLELHSLFIGPNYRVVPEPAALTGTTKPLPSLPAAEVMTRLHTVRQAAQADLAIYVLVSAATSQQVTLQVWVDDAKKPEKNVDGQLIRRNWSDVPMADPNQSLANHETADNTNVTTKSLTFTTPPLDTDKQVLLVRRTLEEWWAARSAHSK